MQLHSSSLSHQGAEQQGEFGLANVLHRVILKNAIRHFGSRPMACDSPLGCCHCVARTETKRARIAASPLAVRQEFDVGLRPKAQAGLHITPDNGMLPGFRLTVAQASGARFLAGGRPCWRSLLLVGTLLKSGWQRAARVLTSVSTSPCGVELIQP